MNDEGRPSPVGHGAIVPAGRPVLRDVSSPHATRHTRHSSVPGPWGGSGGRRAPATFRPLPLLRSFLITLNKGAEFVLLFCFLGLTLVRNPRLKVKCPMCRFFPSVDPVLLVLHPGRHLLTGSQKFFTLPLPPSFFLLPMARSII